MPLTERTWIDEAVRQDYHVGYFGKWHLGPINPEARGAHRFDPEVEVNRHPYDPATSDFSYQRAKERYEAEGRDELIQGRSPLLGRGGKPKSAEATLSCDGQWASSFWRNGPQVIERSPFF